MQTPDVPLFVEGPGAGGGGLLSESLVFAVYHAFTAPQASELQNRGTFLVRENGRGGFGFVLCWVLRLPVAEG